MIRVGLFVLALFLLAACSDNDRSRNGKEIRIDVPGVEIDIKSKKLPPPPKVDIDV